MKKESQTEKSLRLLQKYLDETPQEEIDAEIAKIEAMNFGGPTIDEYFDGLQKSLQNWTRKLTKGGKL
jgi:hypothetical protein